MHNSEARTILGLGATFTDDDVRQAHRKLARQHHPDLGGDVNTFRHIQEAFECLRGQSSGNGHSATAFTVDGRPLSALGNRDKARVPDCARCEGAGYTSTFSNTHRRMCERCRGMGIVVVVPCKFCSGTGCSRCKRTGLFFLKKPGTCFDCSGVGWKRAGGERVEHFVCLTCDGSGQRAMFNPLIPPGAILR